VSLVGLLQTIAGARRALTEPNLRFIWLFLALFLVAVGTYNYASLSLSSTTFLDRERRVAVCRMGPRLGIAEKLVVRTLVGKRLGLDRLVWKRLEPERLVMKRLVW